MTQSVVPEYNPDWKMYAKRLTSQLQNGELLNSHLAGGVFYDSQGRLMMDKDGHHIYNGDAFKIIEPNDLQIQQDDLVDDTFGTGTVAEDAATNRSYMYNGSTVDITSTDADNPTVLGTLSFTSKGNALLLYAAWPAIKTTGGVGNVFRPTLRETTTDTDFTDWRIPFTGGLATGWRQYRNRVEFADLAAGDLVFELGAYKHNSTGAIDIADAYLYVQELRT